MLSYQELVSIQQTMDMGVIKMVYSDVVANGWILAKKVKYTKRDVDSVLINSLFGMYGISTLSKNAAKFIVKCSAIYYCADYSKYCTTKNPRT